MQIKHIREELKSISDEKKVLEHSLSEQQLKIIKLESAETRLSQMTEKYDELLAENRELVERVSGCVLLLGGVINTFFEFLNL